jgi:membrane protein YqaA with SNARE-associated domain
MPYNDSFPSMTLLKFRNTLWAVLQSLGPWGVFLTAALDGAGVPLPGAVDAVLVTFVYSEPLKAWLFVLLAACGSVLGCMVLYLIGYWGGEVLVERRMSPQKFQKIRRDFERHPFLTLAVPAVLPPPFPFKIVVLAAGAFEMKWKLFVVALFAGRVLRFAALSALTIKFGPQVISIFNSSIRRHPFWALAVAAAAVAVFLLIRHGRVCGKTEPAN